VSTFQYRAYTKQGVVTSGTIVADKLDAAIEALYGSGLTPLETVPCADSDLPSVARPTERVWFALAALRTRRTEGVISVYNRACVAREFRRSRRCVISSARRRWRVTQADCRRERTPQGYSGGSAAIRVHGAEARGFPPDYIAILAGGEAGGQTAQALTLIGEMLARRVEIRNKIRGFLVYPAILLMMSLMSIAVIVFVLIPNLTPIFSDAGLPLPGILAVLADLPGNWPKILLWGMLGAILGWIAYRKIGSDETMMKTLDHLKCRLPIIRPLVQRREASQFARSAGSLVEARVPLMAALQTARSLVSNRYLSARYSDAIRRVPEGRALSQVLEGLGLIPQAMIRLYRRGRGDRTARKDARPCRFQLGRRGSG
jgi:general secretion pathway protein F